MEAEKDKLHKYYKNEKMESTSLKFTEKIMVEVSAIAEAPFVVKPLINKRGWTWIIGIGIIFIMMSFLLEFVDSIQEMPTLFDWSRLRWEDFTTSLRVVAGVISLFLILTLADIIYRKVKRLV